MMGDEGFVALRRPGARAAALMTANETICKDLLPPTDEIRALYTHIARDPHEVRSLILVCGAGSEPVEH